MTEEKDGGTTKSGGKSEGDDGKKTRNKSPRRGNLKEEGKQKRRGDGGSRDSTDKFGRGIGHK